MLPCQIVEKRLKKIITLTVIIILVILCYIIQKDELWPKSVLIYSNYMGVRPL
jgi:hypothetical protein